LGVGQEDKLDASIRVYGGGIKSQADAARLGIARALVKLNPNYQKSLKKAGFLTRDARRQERKKSGLKSARVPVQWRKR
jgi:small subunit ribosomal protein S9